MNEHSPNNDPEDNDLILGDHGHDAMTGEVGQPAAQASAQGNGTVFPAWRIWQALLLVGAFALSQRLVGFAGSLAAGLMMEESGSIEKAESRLIFVLLPMVVLVSHLVGWLGAYWLVVKHHQLGFLAALRLDGKLNFRLIRMVFAGIGLQLVNILTISLLPPPENLETPLAQFLAGGPWSVVMLALMAVIMAPLLEEVLFRGILLPAMRKRWAFLPSALVVTVLFTSLHSVQIGGYWPALMGIFMCGFVLAWLRERSDSLWPPIFFHMGFNLLAVLPMFFLRALPDDFFPALLRIVS